MMRLKVCTKAAAWALSPLRNYSPYLFISDKSVENQSIFTPTPDLISKFQNVDKLQNNINIRGMTANAAELKELYEFYSNLSETRNQLEKRRVDIADQTSDLFKVGGKEAKEEAEKLIHEGRLLRQDLKDLMQAFWEVEEKTMIHCLALPNDLHAKTPLNETLIISQETTPRDLKQPNHLEAGQDLIDYRSPYWYYLKNSATVFDQAVVNFFLDKFEIFQFRPIICPDFSSAALVEGCGTDPEQSLRLQPSKENMYLVGGTALSSFAAFYAKNTLPAKSLPIRHVSGGKKYKPGNGLGLFGAWQRTSVDFFVASRDSVTLDAELENILENLKNLYGNLGWEYRLVFLPASRLNFWESFRASFQMFSTSLDDFVEVGSVSISGSFLSERLSVDFEDTDQLKQFCHILSGTAVDVTFVLACLLENNLKNNLIHPLLIPYSFGNI